MRDHIKKNVFIICLFKELAKQHTFVMIEPNSNLFLLVMLLIVHKIL